MDAATSIVLYLYVTYVCLHDCSASGVKECMIEKWCLLSCDNVPFINIPIKNYKNKTSFSLCKTSNNSCLIKNWNITISRYFKAGATCLLSECLTKQSIMMHSLMVFFIIISINPHNHEIVLKSLPLKYRISLSVSNWLS